MKCSWTTQESLTSCWLKAYISFTALYCAPSHARINCPVLFLIQKETLVFPEGNSGSEQRNSAGNKGSAKCIKGTHGPGECGEQQRLYYKSVSYHLSLS